MNGVNLENSKVSEVNFENVDFSNAKLNKISGVNVSFEDSLMTRMNMMEAKLQSSNFCDLFKKLYKSICKCFESGFRGDVLK